MLAVGVHSATFALSTANVRNDAQPRPCHPCRGHRRQASRSFCAGRCSAGHGQHGGRNRLWRYAPPTAPPPSSRKSQPPRARPRSSCARQGTTRDIVAFPAAARPRASQVRTPLEALFMRGRRPNRSRTICARAAANLACPLRGVEMGGSPMPDRSALRAPCIA
eukprot:654708-Pyramimonas_sp.AAC.3